MIHIWGRQVISEPPNSPRLLWHVSLIALLYVVIPWVARAQSPTSHTKKCVETLGVIEGCKTQLVRESSLREGSIVPPNLWRRRFASRVRLTCPAGGTYSLGRIGKPASCSVKEHDEWHQLVWPQYREMIQEELRKKHGESVRVTPARGPFQDLLDFNAGKRVKFDSKDRKKAKGVHMSIEYPKSWQAKEGDRPNVVQKFMGKDDDGRLVQCILVIKGIAAKGPFPPEEVYRPTFMKALAEASGAEYLKGERTKIEGLDAGWMSCKKNYERAGTKLTMYYLQYMVIFDQRWVQIQFIVAGDPDDTDTPRVFAAFLPLFHAIANTIAFPARWR